MFIYHVCHHDRTCCDILALRNKLFQLKIVEKHELRDDKQLLALLLNKNKELSALPRNAFIKGVTKTEHWIKVENVTVMITS